MFDGPGTKSDALSGVLLREMASLYSDYLLLEPHGIVAAFQAYAIYTLVLFFYVSETHDHLWQAMMNLQELASAR